MCKLLAKIQIQGVQLISPDVHMRILILITMAIFLVACGRAEPTGIKLHPGKVERVNECHVLLDHAGGKDDRLVGLRYVCGVPSSAFTEKNWWGDEREPLSFSMNIGDCLLLNNIFFCLEEIEYGQFALFKPTYRNDPRDDEIIDRIEEE